MLFFRPEDIGTPDCTARFDALDGETVCGSCTLLIHDGVADLTALDAQDPEIGEGLFRAALNYAANKGVYMAVCTAPDAGAVTGRMRFEEKDGVLTNDIPTLLMGYCGC